MAEAVLGTQLAEAGLDALVDVESGGTGNWHLGEDADDRALAALSRGGHSLSHTARQVDADWFDDADLVLAMDRANLASLRRMVADPDVLERVRLLRSFDPDLVHLPDDSPDLDVPDPYFGSADGFDRALEMIEKACNGVVERVRADLREH